MISRELPQIIRPGRKPERAGIVPLVRLCVFCATLGLIHWQHQRVEVRSADETVASLLPRVAGLLPETQQLLQASRGGIPVTEAVDADGRVLGWIARTSPAADHVLGFSGPTDMLLIFTPAGELLAAEILGSGDTRDHVRQVREDPDFLPGLRGQSVRQLLQPEKIDGVSGATLTSLAILESVRCRLSASQPGDDPNLDAPPEAARSLRFPEPPRLEDVQRIFAEAQNISLEPESGHWFVVDTQGTELGVVLRTSPAADNLVGYQGPTDTLIGLSQPPTKDAFRVVGIAVGASYDNEPYVGYVREDNYFGKLFRERTLEELSQLDLDAAGVEGVSGATMTSQNVAAGILEMAAWHQTQQLAREARAAEESELQRVAEVSSRTWQLPSLRNLSTIAIACLGAVIGLTRLKGQRWLRLSFQFVLIGWLGLINGDLLSQASIVGWAAYGVPWQNALGLVVLTATALIIPVLTGHNVYCSHICPHGAVQQLLRNRTSYRLRLSGRVQKLLKMIPLLLLAWVLAIALLRLPFSPVDIEPFDAWVWSIAGAATLSIAVGGLVFSLFVPMGYCRFGCPTGVMLSYLRRTPGRWMIRDWCGLGLFVLGLGLCLAV